MGWTMATPGTRVISKAPDKGIFPLDHEGEHLTTYEKITFIFFWCCREQTCKYCHYAKACLEEIRANVVLLYA